MAKIRSSVWGGESYQINQDFGVINPDTAGQYPGPDYTEPLGHPAGTHVGLDIAVPFGSRIFALNEGVVEFAGFNNSFRPFPVYIKTKDDPDTTVNEADYIEIYGHLSANAVDTGQSVKEGTPLGRSGEQTVRGSQTQPDGTGPHLHFELRKPGENTSSGFRAINPIPWLTKTGSVVPDDDGTTLDPVPVPESSGDIFGIATLLETLKSYSQRGFFVLIGIAVLIIGLNSVLSAGGFNVGKKAKKFIPAARIAKLVTR